MVIEHEGTTSACGRGCEQRSRTRHLRDRLTKSVSQMPAVNLARVLALQGATMTMSAHRRSCWRAGDVSKKQLLLDEELLTSM